GYFGSGVLIWLASGSGTTSVTSPQPTISHTSPPPSSTLVPPRVEPRSGASFTQPVPGVSIRAGQNVHVSGTVTGLPPGTKLWIATTATHGGENYYLTSDGPMLQGDGSWDFTDDAVGDSSDINGTIIYHAIRADAL